MSAILDVSAERAIPATPEQIARVMFDPVNDPRWMKAVRSVESLEPGKTGARARRSGRFLGRTIHWTTEVLEYAPPHRLRLRIVDGPFRGDVFYRIEEAPQGSLVRIRNVGEAGSFRFMPRFLMEMAMKSALRADLERLAAAL